MNRWLSFPSIDALDEARALGSRGQIELKQWDLSWSILQQSQAVYDQEFVEVSLSKYKGKYVVLFF